MNYKLIIIFLAFVSLSANAVQGNFYLNIFKTAGYLDNIYTEDKKHNGYGYLLGYELNKNLSISFSHIDLGFQKHRNSTYITHIDAKVDFFEVRYKYSLQDNVFIQSGLGLAHSYREGKTICLCEGLPFNTYAETLEDGNWSLSLSAKLIYSFNKNIYTFIGGRLTREYVFPYSVGVGIQF